MGVDALAICALVLASAPPAVSVEVAPASLVLGQDQRARVRVRSEAGPPRVSVSAGTLGPLVETGPGTYEAELAPPLEAHPQLAMVVALAGDRVAFAALPLVGRGVAVARTAPRARIAVRIREREFGPVQADASGIALVPVEVPPGERYAWQRGRALDLRVPPLRQVHAVLGRTEVRADREETVAIHVVAARPDGTPWNAAGIELAASEGALAPVRETAPGAWTAAWTLAPGRAGEATLEARLAGAPAVRASLRRVPGPPGRVVLRLASERAVAGDAPVGVEAEIADAAGNRVDAEVRLAAAFGTVTAPSRSVPGLVSARYVVPERLEGRRETVVEAAVGDIVDRRVLALAPAAPAALAVTIEPAAVVADGAASAEVRVAVTDRFGNEAGGPPPSLEAGRGTLGALEPGAAPGGYRTRYTAGWSPRGGEDAVVARAGALERSASIRLLEPPRRLTATARAGLVHAFGGFSAPSLSAAVELWPLRLRGAWGLSAGLGLVRTRERETALVGEGAHAVASSTELWPVTVTLLRRRSLRDRIGGFAGVGAGWVAIRSAVSLDGAGREEWGRALALHASAGATYELPSSRARARLEVALGWQEDPGMRSFRGALTTLGLALGVSHDAL